jgi:hypothetical protein
MYLLLDATDINASLVCLEFILGWFICILLSPYVGLFGRSGRHKSFWRLGLLAKAPKLPKPSHAWQYNGNTVR